MAEMPAGAVRWRDHGDHFAVEPATQVQTLGLVMRAPWRSCGWVMTPEGGRVVHPGDWIVPAQAGKFRVVRGGAFASVEKKAA